MPHQGDWMKTNICSQVILLLQQRKRSGSVGSWTLTHDSVVVRL